MRFCGALCALVAVFMAGCSSTYYNAMEKLGWAKRDILVDRIQATRTAQTEAKQQFTSALQHFQAVTGANGGELQAKYEDLNREFERSEARAKEVRSRIAAIEDVADELFREWKHELGEYSSPTLRGDSQRQYDQTHRSYDDLIRLMRRAADRMDPVLALFHDQVLYLKHNLNARALTSLESNRHTLEGDISSLIADMDDSIREAEAFIRNLKGTQG